MAVYENTGFPNPGFCNLWYATMTVCIHKHPSSLQIGKRKRPTNIKKFDGTPPLWTTTSRGRVRFVPWKCPTCPADILSNLCGTTHKSGRDVPDVPGFAPKPSWGHFRDTPTTKFLHVFFVNRFLFFPRESFQNAHISLQLVTLTKAVTHTNRGSGN